MSCYHRFKVWVGSISRGPRGCALLGNYRTSETYAYQDDIGELLLGVCETVPYGVLCFLPSYKSLEKLTKRWMVGAHCEDLYTSFAVSSVKLRLSYIALSDPVS